MLELSINKKLVTARVLAEMAQTIYFEKTDFIRDSKILAAHIEAAKEKVNSIKPLVGKVVDVFVELPSKDSRKYEGVKIESINTQQTEGCGYELILTDSKNNPGNPFSIPISRIIKIVKLN